MKIEKIKLENLEEIVKLHQKYLPYTSSKIGQGYLKSLYKSLVSNQQHHLCLVALEDNHIIGSISGTYDLKKTQGIIKRDLSFSTYLVILKAILTLKVTPYELFQKISFENTLTGKFSKPYSTILTFFVVQDHRRKGVGKKLLNKYIQSSRKNLGHIYVDTLISNKSAQKFYKSNGFKVEKIIIISYICKLSLK